MMDPFKRPEKTEGLHDNLKIGPFEDAQAYSAGERIVAVSGKDGAYSLYGWTQDNIARRTWANNNDAADDELCYVSDFSDGKEFIKGISMLSSTLSLDERALLGMARGVPFDPEKGWATAVTGELRVGPGPALVLRPDVVSYWRTDNTMVFTEEGQAGADATLLVSMSYSSGSANKSTFRATKLDTKGAVLFDRVSDGGWEQVAPTWVATTEGVLRVDGGETATIPYGFRGETRTLEVTDWFQHLPRGARVFLMLDRSGHKELSIHVDGENVQLNLKIKNPALDFVLSGVSCDTSLLVDPLEPPGRDAVLGGPALHLVSETLVPGKHNEWRITKVDDTIQLERAAGDALRTAFHFAPYADWVRPSEAAINDAYGGLSALRVLIPRPAGDAPLKVGLASDGLTVSPDSFPDAPAPTADAVARHGPIASFTLQRTGNVAVRSEELGEHAASGEPAVLRPEYRATPIQNPMGAPRPAPFEATYAMHVPAESITRSVVTSALADQTFSLRAGEAKPLLRLEAAGAKTIRFGWADKQFLRRGSGEDHRLEWLETDAKPPEPPTPANPLWRATPWLRLSDDSLVRHDAWELGELDPAKDLADLTDYTPGGGWILESRLLGGKDEGLSLLSVHESSTGDAAQRAPRFELRLANVEKPLAVVEGPAAEGVVNRLIFAASPWAELPPTDLGAVKVIRLNCVFLEFERTGSKFQLRRGMLGWTASHCFDFQAIGELQFTEFYERKDDGLERMVEFNGGVRSAEIKEPDLKYRVEVYFWSSVLSKEGSSLRVMCKHSLTVGDEERKDVVAVQDALVDGNVLDLSCDLALFQTTKKAVQEVVAFDTWEASRRGLFTIRLDQYRDFRRPYAFLKIRMADKARAAAPDTKKQHNPILIPAWRESDTQVFPWFLAELSDRRSQTTWLRTRLLRTRADRKGSALTATLYFVDNDQKSLPAESYRVCTLATPSQEKDDDVIAQWIPSTIKDITPAQTEPEVQGKSSKLWLFDPFPRTIAEWEASGADKDRKRAETLLAGLGWTREAVLETPPAPPAPSPAPGAPAAPEPASLHPRWDMVDSPLLNRDATIGWLAWPLHKNVQERPSDVLPLTRQVVHIPPVPVRESSVAVFFKSDKADGGYSLPEVYQSEPPLAQPAADAGADVASIGFRSPGLRVGAPHVAVVGSEAIVEPFQGWSMPQSSPTGHLTLEPVGDGSSDVWITWAEADVSMSGVEVAPETLHVHLTLPQGGTWTSMTFDVAPEGLMFQDSEGKWQEATRNQSFQIAPAADKPVLKLKPQALWSEIRLKVGTQPGTSGQVATAAYFTTDGSAARLAGIFAKDQLRLFGHERVWFRPPVDEGANWKRVSRARCSAAENLSVATIDMLGRTALYE